MNIRIKLYAMLAAHLPPGAVKNEAEIGVSDAATVHQVLTSLNVPMEQCHLVLINGVFVAPSERDRHALNEGDALAVWPPVAGG